LKAGSSFVDPTNDELEQALAKVRESFKGNMRIPGGRLPEEFMPTVNSQFDPYQRLPRRPHQQGNPQTDTLLKRLGRLLCFITLHRVLKYFE